MHYGSTPHTILFSLITRFPLRRIFLRLNHMNTWQEKFTNITWDTLREGTFELSKQIETNTLKPDLIVAIARGGLTIAQLLSDSLSLPIATFTVVSYKDLKQSHQPTITHPLGSPLDGKKVLLVDDISDTGITFKRGNIISYGARSRRKKYHHDSSYS